MRRASSSSSSSSAAASSSLRAWVAPAVTAATATALFLWSNAPLLRHHLQHKRRRRGQQQQQQQLLLLPTAEASGPLTFVLKRDLARQGLTRVPREVLSLRQLTELNLMGNSLIELPEEIGGLTLLFRLGLKDNRLESLPDSIGNLTNLVELYLTNNRLAALPASMGRLRKLRKLQASFNCLQTLPVSMRQMEALELFRAACNPELEAVPPHLAQAPALTWLSFGGSRFCDSRNDLDIDLDIDTPASPHPSLSSTSTPWWRQGPLAVIPLSELERGVKLGDGASGDVFRARWPAMGEGKEVALKLFRGDTSPDGRAVDELEVLCLVDHPALTKVRAVVVDDSADVADAGASKDTTPSSSSLRRPAGVVMDLVAGSPLAEKPNATSVLRCRWEEGKAYPLRFVLSVGAKVAGALQHLHALGVMHGDVYAHNIVATPDGGQATLLDYGASFRYSTTGQRDGLDVGVDFERLEVRAWGLFLADLLARCPEATAGASAVKDLVDRCLATQVAARPTFAEIGRALDAAGREAVVVESERMIPAE